MESNDAAPGEDAHRISSSRLSSYPIFVAALLDVKKAAARANQQAGALSQEKRERISVACESLASRAEMFAVDPYSGGGGILINASVNRLIANESGLELTDVNLSQSTADVVATALRIALIRVGEPLQQNLRASVGLMAKNQKKFEHTPSTARTCLQDAMPVALGTLFEGYAHVLERRADSLDLSLRGLHKINLGGTVIGSSEGAAAGYSDQILAEIKNGSGLALEWRKSLFDAAQNADDLGELNHALSLLSEVSIKIAKDLRLLHSGPEHGFGEIRLPLIIQGSSFFKSKNNPTIPETFLQACFVALGRCRTAGLTLEHAELNLNVFEFAGGFALYEALEVLSNAFRGLNENCLQSISAAKGDSL